MVAVQKHLLRSSQPIDLQFSEISICNLYELTDMTTQSNTTQVLTQANQVTNAVDKILQRTFDHAAPV